MALDTAIPLQAVAPDPMQKISGLLNVANNALNYKRNQETFGAYVAQRQAESSSAQSAATVNAANVQPKIEQQAAQTSTAQTGAQSAKFGLQKDYMGTALQTADGLINDPRIAADPAHYDPQAATNAILEAKNQMIAKGVPADQAELATAPLIMKIHEPGAVQQALKNTLTGQLAPQGQAGAITQSGPGVTNGIQSAQINTNPLAGPVGGAVPGTTQTQLVPLGQQQTTVTDRLGNQAVQHKDAFGNTTGLTPMPSSTGQANPPPMASFPPGETDATLKQSQEIRINANQAAATVPDQQFNLNQIIKLADETNTGKGADLVASLRGQYAGTPWSSNSADNFNRLGHFMALQTGQLAQSAGLGNTDAGRSVAQEQAGTQQWTAGAIKSTARVNRALSTGTLLFNEGVENAVKAGNPFAARDFQNQWSQTASVPALQLYDAVKNGDKEGLAYDVKQLGGVNSPQYKQTLKQVDAMRKLIQGH